MNENRIIEEARRNRRPTYEPLLEKNLNKGDGSKSYLQSLNTPEEISENWKLLDACSRYWHNLQSMRERRARVRNFINGEQWSDKVPGYSITEEDVIKSDGNYAAKYNIMQPILKNLLGQFRTSQKKSTVLIRERDMQEEERILTNSIQAIHELNEAPELDAQLITERWMSGVSVQRITYHWWKERDQRDVLIENCEIPRVFFNTDVRDIRLLDLHTCGMLYDYSVEDLITDSNICKSQNDVNYINNIYSTDSTRRIREDLMNTKKQDIINFFVPLDANKCRVIEIWYEKVERKMYVFDTNTGKEYITEYKENDLKLANAKRESEVKAKNEVVDRYNTAHPESPVPYFQNFPLEYEERFEKTTYFKRITPCGKTLQKGKTPFWHQSHPFVFEIRPLTDGDIRGEGCQLIDIQKQYNRFRLLMDVAIKHGIKGVILIPEDAIPDGWTSQDYAREIKRMDGIVVYKVNPNKRHAPKPEQLSNAAPINQMLQAMSQEMKQMMSDVSGTSQALLGRDAKSGTPASLYAQESGNAAMNAIDFFKSFEAFLRKRDMKVLKTLQQYYPKLRRIVTLGMTSDTDILEYEREKLADLDTDVMVVSASTNPMEKADQEADLREMVKLGMLPMEVWLKNSTLPYAKQLLNDIDDMKQAMGVEAQAPSPEQLAQAQAQAQQQYGG